MTLNLSDSRILAIVLRSQRLGFVVAEGSIGLVHWGMIYFEGNEKLRVATAMKRMQALFARFTPYHVAIERSKIDGVPNPGNVHLLYLSIRQEAFRRYVPVSMLTRVKVREAFQDFGIRSKDDIAALLAKMFPELQSKLPPKRKLWKREHFSMPLFDAVALAVAAWRQGCLRE